MNKQFLFWLVYSGAFLLLGYGNAEAESMADKAKAIQTIYQELQIRPANKQFQTNYLSRFPRSKQTFKAFFVSANSELTPSAGDYLFELESIANQQPEAVIEILLKLAVEISWGSEAVSYLQTVLAKSGLGFPNEFARGFKHQSESNQKLIIAFLRQGRHGAFGYDRLTYMMERLGHNEIAVKLKR